MTAFIEFMGQAIVYRDDVELAAWRARTLDSKEPATNAWLAALPEGEPVIDVGANVGYYALWAAMAKQAPVIALEPHVPTCAVLLDHLRMNAMQSRITAYPIGAGDADGPAMLHMAQNEPGGSCHALGEAINFRGERKDFPMRQGSFALRLDALCAALALSPRHLKIDVDGFEPRVIAGARDILARSVRSLIVETNHNLAEHRAMSRELETLGFRCDATQIEAAKRKSGPFENVGEVVWTKATI